MRLRSKREMYTQTKQKQKVLRKQDYGTLVLASGSFMLRANTHTTYYFHTENDHIFQLCLIMLLLLDMSC